MQKRVVIIDFNHQAHTYFFSRFRLSIRVDGAEKDTTVQTNTMKNLYRWSHKGVFPTAVCFDRPVPARKMYFQSNFPDIHPVWRYGKHGLLYRFHRFRGLACSSC